MSDGGHDLKRFIIEGGGEYARFLEGKGDHDDIEFSTLQHPSQVLCEIFFEFERHFGCTCAQQWNQIGKDIRSYCRDHSEPQKPIQLIFALSSQDLDSIGFFQNSLSLMDDLFAKRSQLHLVLSTLKNGRA